MSQNVCLFWPWHGFFQNTNSPRSHLAKHLATGTEGSGAESSTNSWHWGGCRAAEELPQRPRHHVHTRPSSGPPYATVAGQRGPKTPKTTPHCRSRNLGPLPQGVHHRIKKKYWIQAAGAVPQLTDFTCPNPCFARRNALQEIVNPY